MATTETEKRILKYLKSFPRYEAPILFPGEMRKALGGDVSLYHTTLALKSLVKKEKLVRWKNGYGWKLR